jgi:hypothetical protein
MKRGISHSLGCFPGAWQRALEGRLVAAGRPHSQVVTAGQARASAGQLVWWCPAGELGYCLAAAEVLDPDQHQGTDGAQRVIDVLTSPGECPAQSGQRLAGFVACPGNGCLDPLQRSLGGDLREGCRAQDLGRDELAGVRLPTTVAP